MAWSPIAINLGHHPAGAAQPLSKLGATAASASRELPALRRLLMWLLLLGQLPILAMTGLWLAAYRSHEQAHGIELLLSRAHALALAVGESASRAQRRSEGQDRAETQRLLDHLALPATWTAAVVEMPGTIIASIDGGGHPDFAAEPGLLERAREEASDVVRWTTPGGTSMLSAVVRSPVPGRSAVVTMPRRELHPRWWNLAWLWLLLPLPAAVLSSRLAARALAVVDRLWVASVQGRRSSARLGQVEKLLEAILQAGSDAIVVIDARHSVVLANQAAVRTFGRPADEMAGAGVSHLLTPDTFARYLEKREVFEAGLAATEPRQLGMGWGRRADGSPFRIDGTLMLFSDAPGRRFCTLVVRAVGMDHETVGQRPMNHDFQGVLVQEAESRQAAIGRELHDGVASSLTGVNLLLARACSSALPAEAAGLIRAAQEQVVVAMQHVRRLSRGIMPAGQDDGALVPALEMFAADMDRLPGIRCLITCRGEFADVSGEVGSHLVRIVQEATNNALRHGGARRIRIMLARLGEQCRLTVTDDGKGCDPRGLSGPVAGMGIRSMRARAKAIGGVFTATPRPGRGVRVRVTWSATKQRQTAKP